MSASATKHHRPWPQLESRPVETGDASSELLEACEARFRAPDYEVACDIRHTVWVRRADGARSVGLSPWMLRTRSMSVLLEGVGVRLETPAGDEMTVGV